MSWLSKAVRKLTGRETADKVLDGAIKGLDAIFYTSEEQAQSRQQLADQWLKLQEVLGQESTVRSVTRRILAILIIVPYVFLVLLAAAAYPFSPPYSQFLLELANSQFGLMALGVATFYFGPYMLNYLRGKKK